MADILADVAEEKPKRPRTIPIWDERYQWWTEAVERELTARKWKRSELARRLGVKGWDITRSVNRGGATVELVTRIADLLGLPYPVFLPESEAEAKEMMERRALAQQVADLRKRDAEMQRKLAELGNQLMQIRGEQPKRRRRAG